MGLFRTKPDAAQLALSALQAENSDLRAQLRLEREQFEAERVTLIDRILSLTNPIALREVRRTPLGESAPSPFPDLQKSISRRLPPYPPRTTGTPPTSSGQN